MLKPGAYTSFRSEGWQPCRSRLQVVQDHNQGPYNKDSLAQTLVEDTLARHQVLLAPTKALTTGLIASNPKSDCTAHMVVAKANTGMKKNK